MLSCDSIHGRPDFSKHGVKAIEFGEGKLSCMKHEDYIIVDLELPKFKKYADSGDATSPYATLEVHESNSIKATDSRISKPFVMSGTKKHVIFGEFVLPKDYKDIDAVIKRVEGIPGCRMHQLHFHPKSLHYHVGCTIHEEVTPLFRDIMDMGIRRWQD